MCIKYIYLVITTQLPLLILKMKLLFIFINNYSNYFIHINAYSNYLFSLTIIVIILFTLMHIVIIYLS